MKRSRVIIELGDVTNSCFVVMPFASNYERQYTHVIKPAVESVGLTCVRGDEIYSQQSIIQDVWKSIRTCRVVIAELSGRNPNVMYEVGLAHALGKPIIMITRKKDDVPFDLQALRYVYYDIENPEWGADLKIALSNMLEKVVNAPASGAHLHGVIEEATLPATPERPTFRVDESIPSFDISGVWRTSWISVKKERKHIATLVIPKDHGTDFTASMTVSYLKGNEQTVVEETLKGTLFGNKLSLLGISYTYVERGTSIGYTLDDFDLNVSPEADALEGNVTLRHGVRAVSFCKSP